MCHFKPYLGANFNKHARETSYSKASLGAFPPIHIAPRNAKLVPAVKFARASRLFFHAAIYKCFDDFNRGRHPNGQAGQPANRKDAKQFQREKRQEWEEEEAKRAPTPF
jgi:hypothetical protein